MNISSLVFALIAYSVLKGMIIDSTSNETNFNVPEYPESDVIEFRNVGCNEIILCLDGLVDVFYNIGAVFINIGNFIIDFVVYLGKMVAFIAKISFTPLNDAPAYVNILLFTPFTFLIALIIFKLAAKGDDE